MKAIWKGSITFGLVNIPVEMHSISAAREIQFTLLHEKDLSPIRYARICKEENKEVPWDEIVKGYEEKGKMVVMTSDEIKKALAPNTHTIEILQFVKEQEIDSVYYDKPYVLAPQKGSDKAYHLLLDAIDRSKKVGVALYTIHGREHLGVVKPFEHFIILNQLRFQEELKLEELKGVKGKKAPSKEVDIAVKLIDQMTGKFKPFAFQDSYVKEIQKIVKKKKPLKKPQLKQRKSPKVQDMMSLLKASLEKAG